MRFGPEWSGRFYCVWLGNETLHKLGVIWGLCRVRGGRGCLGDGTDSRCQIVSPNPSWVLHPPHDAFWAPAFCLSQAHTLSWRAHRLGLHAHTSGPCPSLSPHSQGSILPVFPHCWAYPVPAWALWACPAALCTFHSPLTSPGSCHT